MNQPPIIPGAPPVIPTNESRKLKSCADCKGVISRRAEVCPHCGAKASRNPSTLAFVFAVVLIGIAGYSVDSALDAADTDRKATSDARPSQAEFLPSSGRIDEGTALYLAETKELVGTVVTTELNHRFPDGTERQGVLIRYKDGSENWVPIGAVKKLYVVRNENR